MHPRQLGLQSLASRTSARPRGACHRKAPRRGWRHDVRGLGAQRRGRRNVARIGERHDPLRREYQLYGMPTGGCVRMNCLGAIHALRFAERCQDLCCHVHVSTSYANSTQRNKVIYEKLYPLDSDVETKICEIQSTTPDEIETIRANVERIGYPSLYRFAKSMAELLVAAHTAKASIPLAIFRPTTIGAAWKDPVPGWVDHVIPSAPLLNVVPVDMTANSLLTAAGFKMIESSSQQQKPRIMHCGTSDPRRSPVQLGYLLGKAAKYYLKNSPPKALAPCKMHATPSSMRFHTHWHLKHTLPSYLYATMATCTRNPQHEMQAMGFSKVSRQARRMINSYRPFTENDRVFRTDVLHDQIDAFDDSDEWWHSAGGIAWDDCVNSYCDGLQQFAIRDKPPKSKFFPIEATRQETHGRTLHAVFVAAAPVGGAAVRAARIRDGAEQRAPQVAPAAGVDAASARQHARSDECILHNGKSWLLQALGAPPLIVVSSAETFEDVLKTQFEIFDKGERMRTIFSDVFGDGIVAVDGDKWKFQRKKLSHLFTMRAFRDTITTAVHDKVRILGDVLAKSALDQDTPISIGDVFQRFAFDTFAQVGFGLESNTLSSGQNNSFISALTTIGEVMERRFHQPDLLWQLKRFLRIGDEKRLAECTEQLNKELYAVIYENLRRKNDPKYAKQMAARSMKDVVSLFLDELDDEGKGKASTTEGSLKVDIKFLRDIALTILGAGKETTAWTLAWFVINLNRYPNVATKIRTELRAKLPQLFTDTQYVPSMDDVDQLVYLEAAVRESLRLYPLVPLNAKEANADTTLCDGTFVQKGSRVYIPSYALGRMPSVWGPDAAEFKPERWIEHDPQTGNETLIHVSTSKFVSFHAGPRICLGMRFAIFELKTSLAYVLSKYDLVTVKPPDQFTYEIASALVVKGPVLVHVRDIRGE
ncbi:Cytochrome p450, partial [Globisporangium splendens]